MTARSVFGSRPTTPGSTAEIRCGRGALAGVLTAVAADQLWASDAERLDGGTFERLGDLAEAVTARTTMVIGFAPSCGRPSPKTRWS